MTKSGHGALAGLTTLTAIAALSGCSQQGSGLPFAANAESCGNCHSTEYAAWAESPHGTSGSSPVFEALLVEVEGAWGKDARSACVDCHQPGHGGDVGIGCVSCHGATGNTGERDGRLRVDLERPLMGPRGERNGAHETRSSGFLTSASLCGTCHEVTGPGLLDEPTLTEHRASDFAALGVSCAACHMPEGEHRFVGIDPAWGADPRERQRAEDDARALFRDAVNLRVEVDGREVVISLTNVGAGHSVPTGAAFLRDVWVDLSFDEDAPRRVLSLSPDMRRSGAPTALITDADEVVSRSLEAGEARQTRTPAPVGAATFTATLRLRAIRWETLDALGLIGRRDEVPTLNIQTVTGEFN